MAKLKNKKVKSSPILTARDMLNGYVANSYDYNIYNMTPLQMIPMEEKDEDWKKWNMDWLERAGLRQLTKDQKRMVKNYYLANGILDRSDYVISPDNEFSEAISLITDENYSTLPIKFYPLIPNVINLLCGEFTKRDNKVVAVAVDEYSKTEAYDAKMDMVTQILTQEAEIKKIKQLVAMGIDPQDAESPEQAQQVKQEIDTAKALAEAEVKFKNYRGIVEQWANHKLQEDAARFDLYQKEYDGFRDSLVVDREFWHIKLQDSDYTIELWEPWNVFYHKSPHIRYISEANYVGRILLMSIPDVIDTYGDRMTEDQLLQLKNHYRTLNNFPLVTEGVNDQDNWYNNFSRPFPQSRTNVTWQKWLDANVGRMLKGEKPNDMVSNMTWYDLGKAGQYIDMDINGPGMVRVTESYWRSQKRVGHLTRKTSDGILIQEVVDENYIVTEKPVYNTSLNKGANKETLVSGEHIDWIWINEVRYGVKLNSSLSTYYTRNYSDFEPIYIGGDPLPFQFKGDGNIYGCKLPVEGKIFSERGSFSHSLVDKMKPNQINFNIVNNQMVEMLADEVGNVIVIDQNMIPRNSLNGEWGKFNYPMFHQVMKDYNIAAVDPSMQNTGVATNFSHFQSVDLTKTNQIMSRMKLGEYFKNECFAVVGITPQRLGEVAASESATGTQQAVNNSYAQTEIYFDQHSNHLMPRVREMMLNAAQFYAATKPEAVVNYLNRDEEKVVFKIEGTKLLNRDLRVIGKSTANMKAMLQKLEALAQQGLSAGGSLSEVAKMVYLQSPSEIIESLEKAEAKREEMQQQQQQHEQDMQAQAEQHEKDMEARIEQHDDYWKEREIQKEIYLHQIDAIGRAKNNDINSDLIPDALEAQQFLHQQGIDFSNQMAQQRETSLKERQLMTQVSEKAKDRALAREELKSRENIEKMKVKARPKPSKK